MEDHVLQQLTEILRALTPTNPQIANKIRDIVREYKETLSIDKDLLSKLQFIANAHHEELLTGDQYDELIKKINNNSIIVYFKSANAFRVYDASQISTDLTNHLYADFKNNKEMYEVIPNSLPQKIIIMCEEDVIEHMDIIKNYVIEFMKKKGVKGLTDSDIRTFKNDSGFVEIVINRFYAANYEERDKIVSGLMQYIDVREHNSNVTNQMGRKEFTPFEHAKLVAMPNCKKQLNGENFVLAEALIRNIDDCKHLTTGNVYHINIGTLNVSDTVNMVKNIHPTIPTKEIGDFGQYIKDNRPDWYIPKKLMDKEAVRNKYIEQYGDISNKVFHDTFVGKLFKKTVRQMESRVRTTKILLFDYDEILNLDGY